MQATVSAFLHAPIRRAQAAHPVVLHHFHAFAPAPALPLSISAPGWLRGTQAAVGQIAAIGEDFLARRQLIMLSGADKLAARQPKLAPGRRRHRAPHGR